MTEQLKVPTRRERIEAVAKRSHAGAPPSLHLRRGCGVQTPSARGCPTSFPRSPAPREGPDGGAVAPRRRSDSPPCRAPLLVRTHPGRGPFLRPKTPCLSAIAPSVIDVRTNLSPRMNSPGGGTGPVVGPSSRGSSSLTSHRPVAWQSGIEIRPFLVLRWCTWLNAVEPTPIRFHQHLAEGIFIELCLWLRAHPGAGKA